MTVRDGADHHHHQDLVFVYGTLRRGEMNHRLLATARSLGPARTGEGFSLVDLGPYPALVREGQRTVCGEIYEVDARTLQRLDDFEGCPELFTRERISLAGLSWSPWAYLMTPLQVLGKRRLVSGDWCARERIRR